MSTEDGGKPPWKRKNPKTRAGTSTHLSAAERAEARARARKAGRPYPNLVDNMAVARKRAAPKRKSAAVKKR